MMSTQAQTGIMASLVRFPRRLPRGSRRYPASLCLNPQRDVARGVSRMFAAGHPVGPPACLVTDSESDDRIGARGRVGTPQFTLLQAQPYPVLAERSHRLMKELPDDSVRCGMLSFPSSV